MGSGTNIRTKNAMRNSTVALVLQFIAMLLGFFTRKIFLDCLGTELLGLGTTVGSLLGFLNLAELGIGGAIAFTLYKPIYEHDENTIREILALQGWIYRIVAGIIIIASAILLPFFPKIFAKADVPEWYPYITFFVMLYGNLLGYFLNYKMNVVDASQQNYKVQIRTRLIGLIRQASQAVAVYFMTNGYLWWLGLDAASATVSTILLMTLVRREHPYLNEKVKNPWLLRKKYPGIFKKVGQLFCHKIGSFALGQISPIIIYAYSSLTMVGLYGNYCILTNNLGSLMGAVFDGPIASIGNMVAEGNKKLILKVFRELYSSRFVAASICCICLYILAEPFVSIWLGPEYILNRNTLIIMILLFLLGNTRNTVEHYLFAHGLFRDIWAPLVEATINVTCSIILGMHYGLSGVLCGSLISLSLVILVWKPFFLFRYGLKEPLSFYLKIYFKHVLLLAVSAAVMISVASIIPMDPAKSFLTFLPYAAVVFILTTAVMGGLTYLTEEGFRGFLSRTISAIKNR